jgi:hypothetical protein
LAGAVAESLTMDKPILFHDIDGVIFGYYGPAGHLQPRPGLADWVQWVHENFTVIWFSVRREAQVRELMRSLCLEQLGTVRVAQWNSYADKEPWLAVEVKKLNGRPWLWIDDHIASVERLEYLGLTVENCIRVCPDGSNELEVLKGILEERLELIQKSVT